MSPVNHSPLFRLPRELRDLIYEQVFADSISNPLYIRMFCANPQWRVCHDLNARVPGILMTSKAIYSESKSFLSSSCGPPRILIDDHWSPHRKSGKSPEEYGEECGFAVRDLETILPVLATVEELNLEIKALSQPPPCLVLVRWIRAVLNARETQLRKASIGLRVGMRYPDILSLQIVRLFEEIFEEAARINTQNRPLENIWLLKRTNANNWAGPSFGFAWSGRHAVQAEVPETLPCSVAWRDLIQCTTPVGPSASEEFVAVQPSRYLSTGPRGPLSGRQ
jgi:hypothetical protein